MDAPQKILVTGGAGYIGSHTVDQLIQAGFPVTIFDNFSTGHQKLVHPQAKLIQGDTRNTDLLHRALVDNEIDSVIHFAAFTSVAESMVKPELYYDNNFGGTISLLMAMENTEVKGLVFSSTAAVYADPGKEPVTENSPTDPVTPYGKSKLMSEKAIADFAQASGLSAMILRYFNVAGASLSGRWGQVGDEHTVLVKRAALAAIGKISQLEVFGTDYSTPDGTAIRDYIHVEDLSEIHIEALKLVVKPQAAKILNCGYGHGFSVRQVIDTMKKVTGSEFSVIEKSRRPGDLAQVISNITRLEQEFSWKPKRDSLELICKTAYEWEKSSSRTSGHSNS